MMRTLARTVPVVAAIGVVVWGPGVWPTAGCGLAILVYLLGLETIGPYGRGAIARAGGTLGVAVIAVLLVTVVFRLPTVASWVAVPVGVAAASMAYVVAVRVTRPGRRGSP